MRTVMSFWWLATLVLTNFYVANLAAILNWSHFESPINTMEELIESNTEWFIRKGTVINTLLDYVNMSNLSVFIFIPITVFTL